MCAILKWREINGFGFGGGRGNIITHTHICKTTSLATNNIAIYSNYGFSTALEDFSGKTTAGFACASTAEPSSVSEENFPNFF